MLLISGYDRPRALSVTTTLLRAVSFATSPGAGHHGHGRHPHRRDHRRRLGHLQQADPRHHEHQRLPDTEDRDRERFLREPDPYLRTRGPVPWTASFPSNLDPTRSFKPGAAVLRGTASARDNDYPVTVNLPFPDADVLLVRS